MLQKRDLGESGHNFRSGLFFQVRSPSRLIGMVVVEQDGLDVGHLETKAFDVFLNALGGVDVAGAKQNVALRRSQKVYASIGVPDKVQVPHDFEWIRRPAGVRDLRPDLQRCRDDLLAQFKILRRERRPRSLPLEQQAGGREQQCYMPKSYTPK